MSDAGVRKGFIILKANDQPMRKVSDLEEVMKAAVKSPNQVLFLTGVFTADFLQILIKRSALSVSDTFGNL